MDKRDFTVLVVDDEADIREVLEIALADEGFHVLLAEDGQKAMEVFLEARPPIVITDIKMPAMGGVELLRQVKQENPETEVLMITGHGDMALTIASLKFGAVDFITKPVNVEILTLAVSKAVERIIARKKLTEYTQRLELLVLEKSKLKSHLSSLGLMIGTISHDVKGVLTNLDGGIYLTRSAMEKGDVPGATQGLGMLEQAVDRIKKLILDILMYSKERELALAPVTVDTFTREISQAMAMKIGARAIAFRLDIDRAPKTMTVDAQRMMSALINILDNAVDACVEDRTKPAHWIELGIEEQGDSILLWVKDNGCGMDLETRERIFDLFYSSKPVGGTGFGLFITHSIITRHRGTIRVESGPGKGAGFYISLPLDPGSGGAG